MGDIESPDARPRTTTRNAGVLGQELTPWLRERLGADEPPEVEVLGGPEGGGFSSETVLFDVAWRVAGVAHQGSYVLRLAPPEDAYPLFPRYELARQAAVMRLVRDRTCVPVPNVPWTEDDPTVLGAAFFVMERIAGVAATDMPPYVLGGWLADASPEEQATAEAGVVSLLVGIHGIEVPDDKGDLAFLEFATPGLTPLRRHIANQRAYYDWIRGDRRFPLIEAVFERLEEI